MSLVLRWRVPDRAIITRWRGPEGLAEAVARNAEQPVAAIVGPPGPTGPAGPQGPAGSTQRIDAALAATWILPHALGRVPMVQVFIATSGLAAEEVIADVEASPTGITVTHASPQQGFVIIS